MDLHWLCARASTRGGELTFDQHLDTVFDSPVQTVHHRLKLNKISKPAHLRSYTLVFSFRDVLVNFLLINLLRHHFNVK